MQPSWQPAISAGNDALHASPSGFDFSGCGPCFYIPLTKKNSPTKEPAAAGLMAGFPDCSAGLLAGFLFCGTATLASSLLDGPARGLLHTGASPGLLTAARLLSRYGDWPWLAGPVIAGWIWARRSGRSELRRLLGMMLLCFVLAGLAGLVIRVTTGRARPSTTSAQGWHGLRLGNRWLVGVYEYNSFPSGHTTAAAGMVGSLVFARRRWGWMALALPVSIGWSRIVLDCHHLSDVVAATGLGLTSGWFVWRWKGRKPEPSATAASAI